MLATVQGIFENGRVELREDPPRVERARVIVTFLPEEPTAAEAAPSAANRSTLDLLRSWQDEPLSPKEASVLGDFEAFQARHPLRLAQLSDLDEEP